MDDLVIVKINQESGFMRDYTLTSVITTNGLLPLSGPGNAFYQKGDETYRLQANWINGKKEGKAILYNSHNQVCAQLNYVDDEINGDCVIRDDKGITRFHGNMVNGEKDGICEEYDQNRVRIFYGYYQGGEKHQLLIPVSPSLPHLLKEYSQSGVLLTIAEYDSLNCWKDGHCFFYEGNCVVRCDMMRQGRRQFTCATFASDVMTCFDEEGHKVYEGSYKNDVANLFCKEGIGREFDASGHVVYNGLFHDDQRCWKFLPNPRNPSEIAINDMETNALLFVIHVDSEGRREGDCSCYENGKLTHVTWWENGVEKYTRLVFSDDEATEYASDGITVIYVGHIRNNKRNGEGTEYRDGLPSYVGQWTNGVPNGQGALLDEFGDVVCEGEWRWGYLLTTEGWLDYASREVTQVEEPYDLPLWSERGGERNQKGTIEMMQQSVKWMKLKKEVVDKGEWIQFSLYLVYALIAVYMLTLVLFPLYIAIISVVIELILSFLLSIIFKINYMVEEYRSTIPLQVLSWIMAVESIIAGIRCMRNLNNLLILLAVAPFYIPCFIWAYASGDISYFLFCILSTLPSLLICCFFSIPFVSRVSNYMYKWMLWSVVPLPFILSDYLSHFVLRFTPIYCIIFICLNMMVLDKSNRTINVVLFITGIFILIWLLVYFMTSESVSNSLNDKLRRREEVLKRLTSSTISLPKPIPVSQESHVKRESSRSTMDKSTRVCICLL